MDRKLFVKNKIKNVLLFVTGVNCLFDLDSVLKTLKRMKAALDKEGLSPYLMCQPVGWRCLEVENHPYGYLSLPDYPLCACISDCTYNDTFIFSFVTTRYP